MLIRFVRPRAQLATLGAVVVVLGGVACSALSAVPPSAPAESASTNLTAAQPPVAGAPPAKAVAGGVALGAPAAGAASDAASPQRAAIAANAAAAPNSLPDSSAQILDRMVLRTAQLTVQVTDMESALAQARQIATRGGGFVSASNTRVEKVSDQDRIAALDHLSCE